MKSIVLACTALLVANVGWADCERPEMPAIPDGSEAERAEMLEAHGGVQAYMKEGNAYLECLKEEEAAEVEAASETAMDESSKARLEASSKARMEEYNSAVDDMQAVGDDFNASLKQFNARQN